MSVTHCVTQLDVVYSVYSVLQAIVGDNWDCPDDGRMSV